MTFLPSAYGCGTASEVTSGSDYSLVRLVKDGLYQPGKTLIFFPHAARILGNKSVFFEVQLFFFF